MIPYLVMPTTISPVTQAIVISAANDVHRQHFGRHHGEDVDDLIQIGLIAALKAHQSYRFEFGTAYSTWINRAIRCDWADRGRSLDRRRSWHREKGLRTTHDVLTDSTGEGNESAESLPERLRRVYLLAKSSSLPVQMTPVNAGWRTQRARRVAVAWLFGQVRGLSTRGMVAFLDGRPDLREMIGLKQTPSVEWANKCKKSLTLFSGNS